MLRATVKYFNQGIGLSEGILLDSKESVEKFRPIAQKACGVGGANLRIEGITKLIEKGQKVFINKNWGYCNVDGVMAIISTNPY